MPVTWPDVFMRTTEPLPPVPWRATHRLPSAPAAIPIGWLPAGRGNSSIDTGWAPWAELVGGTSLPTWPALNSANQMFPSGPGVIPSGPEPPVGRMYSSTRPPSVPLGPLPPTEIGWMRTTLPTLNSVAHSMGAGVPELTPGPTVIASGSWLSPASEGATSKIDGPVGVTASGLPLA